MDSTVQDTTPPVITIVSPENREYTSSLIRFQITTDKTAFAQFNVDGGANITMNDGSGLVFYYDLTISNGAHVANFWVTDGSGNLAFESTPFSVDKIVRTRKGGNNKDNDDIDRFFFLENSPEGNQYLSQQDSTTPVTIGLEDSTTDSKQETNVFEAIWESIANFFRNLFGF